MFVLAAEHPVLAAALVIFATWVIRSVTRGYHIRKTFHDQVRYPRNRDFPIFCGKVVLIARLSSQVLLIHGFGAI